MFAKLDWQKLLTEIAKLIIAAIIGGGVAGVAAGPSKVDPVQLRAAVKDCSGDCCPCPKK